MAIGLLISWAMVPHHRAHVRGSTKLMPPSFVTSPALPDCDSEKEFPQLIKLPHFKNSWHTQFSCDYYDRDYVAWAMLVFYNEWFKEFGDPTLKVYAALQKTHIDWGEKRKVRTNVYDIEGTLINSAEVWGLYLREGRMWVYAMPGKPLSSTALVHELVHLALEASGAQPDADHEGDEIDGWTRGHTRLIIRVNKILGEKYGI